MNLLRKHKSHLCSFLAAVWLFALALAIANGCLSGGGTTLPEHALAAPAVALHHTQHAGADKAVCASICESESTLSFSKSPIDPLAFATLLPLAVCFFIQHVEPKRSNIRLRAHRARPVKPRCAIVFLRLNN